MKSITGKTSILIATAVMLFSFTSNFGGEGFEISLNGKVILQKYGKEMDNVNILKLGHVGSNDEVTIKYHHCGKIGKQRIVTIKDGNDNILKQIRFADETRPYTAMSFYLKDIPGLSKNSVLKLYYASNELPGGRLLTSIITPANTLASR